MGRKISELLGLILPPIRRMIDQKADPPDWAQNDPAAKDYIQNRPGGYTRANTLLDDTLYFDDLANVVSAQTYASAAPLCGGCMLENVPFPGKGVECIVTLDGVEYRQRVLDDVPGLGNRNFLQNQTFDGGVPFAMIWYGIFEAGGTEEQLIIFVPDVGSTHSVKLVVKEFVKIPASYVDGTLPYATGEGKIPVYYEGGWHAEDYPEIPEVPLATSSVAGKVKIGSGVSVAADGTISTPKELPTSGASGQFLRKTSNGSEWADIPAELPATGATGQILAKTSAGTEWVDKFTAEDSVKSIPRNVVRCVGTKHVVKSIFSSCSDIVYFKGKFYIACSMQKPHISMSQDGCVWKGVADVGNGFDLFATDGQRLIGVSGNSDNAVYSDDGVSWIKVSVPSKYQWSAALYANGKYIVLARNSEVGICSADGITWENFTTPKDRQWNSLAYGNGKYVALGYGRKYAYSEDGIAWTSCTFPDYVGSNTTGVVTFHDGKFVMVRSPSSVAAYSTDGLTWTATDMPWHGSWGKVDWVGDKFIAFCSTKGRLSYSLDGILWALCEPFDVENQYIYGSIKTAYGNGIYVAAYTVKGNDNEHIMYSHDGIVWRNEYITYELATMAGNCVLFPEILPTHTAADAGKVLGVDADGNLAWITPGT